MTARIDSIRPRRSSVLAALCAAVLVIGPAAATSAWADKIANPLAVFAGLDKITARITAFEVPIGQTVTFGALKVTPRVCYSRPPTEPPRTSAFVEIDEIELDKSEKRIFTGWMFASSPGLHAVEHPVFDVWLTACKTPEKAAAADAATPAAAPAPTLSPPR
ncbi:MAG: DUF2155 domain-containing protein [Rhodobiaceae bacterium]|nr:DUF2155 domain-containing protein [Rhodobiaceae bacterium]